MNRAWFSLIACLGVIGITSCSNDVAGTSSGTENTIALQSGSGNTLARVTLIPTNDSPQSMSPRPHDSLQINAQPSSSGMKAELPDSGKYFLIAWDNHGNLLWQEDFSVKDSMNLLWGFKRATQLRTQIQVQGSSDEIWWGMPSTGRYSAADSLGNVVLDSVYAQMGQLVVYVRQGSEWKESKIGQRIDWSGRSALPPKLEITPGEDIDICATESSNQNWKQVKQMDQMEGSGQLSYILQTSLDEVLQVVGLDLCRGEFVYLNDSIKTNLQAGVLMEQHGDKQYWFEPETGVLQAQSEAQEVDTLSSKEVNFLSLNDLSTDGKRWWSARYLPSGTVVRLHESEKALRQDDYSQEISLKGVDSSSIHYVADQIHVLDNKGMYKCLDAEKLSEVQSADWSDMFIKKESEKVLAMELTPSGDYLIWTNYQLILRDREQHKVLKTMNLPAVGMARGLFLQ